MIHSIKKITDERYDNNGHLCGKTYSEIDEYDYNQYGIPAYCPSQNMATETTSESAQETHLLCNKCGKELDYFDKLEGIYYHNQLGYGSSHDGDTISLRLCLDCFDELVDACIISPVVNDGE